MTEEISRRRGRTRRERLEVILRGAKAFRKLDVVGQAIYRCQFVKNETGDIVWHPLTTGSYTADNLRALAAELDRRYEE